MNAYSVLFDIAETPLYDVPRFPVEAPDGIRCWPELSRQSWLIKRMRLIAPRVRVEAVPNAGKRNPRKAKLEGITAGVFDLTCRWDGGEACPEMKGYDKRGKPGTLSQAQIDWGNAMLDMGKDVACFFHPETCIEWLRLLGAPFEDAA
jgi:hypothetical protein